MNKREQRTIISRFSRALLIECGIDPDVDISDLYYSFNNENLSPDGQEELGVRIKASTPLPRSDQANQGKKMWRKFQWREFAAPAERTGRWRNKPWSE